MISVYYVYLYSYDYKTDANFILTLSSSNSLRFHPWVNLISHPNTRKQDSDKGPSYEISKRKLSAAATCQQGVALLDPTHLLCAVDANTFCASEYPIKGQ